MTPTYVHYSKLIFPPHSVNLCADRLRHKTTWLLEIRVCYALKLVLRSVSPINAIHDVGLKIWHISLSFSTQKV